MPEMNKAKPHSRSLVASAWAHFVRTCIRASAVSASQRAHTHPLTPNCFDTRTKDISTAVISLTVLIFNGFSLRNRTTTSS